MIKKLRRKFVFINMTLVTLVLLIVFTILCSSTYQRLQGQSYDAMRQAISWDGNRLPPKLEIGDKGPHRRPPSFTPVFCVQLASNGEILKVIGENVEITDEALHNALSQVSASGLNQGILRSLNLRFLREQTADGAKIAFADRSSEVSSMANLLLTSLLVGFGGFAAFFVISLFLSSWALRPVEEAWRRQRQFVADASHELKTPLTVILANTGILLSHPEETIERQAKWVVNIKAESERMKKLVDDLLFLAKSDAARAPLSFSPFNFSDTVWSCLLPFEPVAFEQGLTLDNEIAPDIQLTGDESQLKQLTVILLDNACKYAGPNGQVKLTLEAAQERVKLAVWNSGEPIPEAHLAHLFERFYRADDSRARSQGGYGLGLAIAHQIAGNHHGKISVTSSSDAGTCFTVLLPIK